MLSQSPRPWECRPGALAPLGCRWANAAGHWRARVLLRPAEPPSSMLAAPPCPLVELVPVAADHVPKVFYFHAAQCSR